LNGEQVIGTAGQQSFSSSGSYSIDPSGELTLTNPQNPALTINARYGQEAVVGSSTEAPGNTFDFFIAIPAGPPPVSGQIPGYPFTTSGFDPGHRFVAQQLPLRTVMMSASGNIFIAGTPGGHDILIGVKTAGATAANGRYWFSEIRNDANGATVSTGSETVLPGGVGSVASSRVHQSISNTALNLTVQSTSAPAMLAGDGGTALPTGGDFGLFVPMPAISTPAAFGVFVNPQGIVNAASNNSGGPISPGEFISIYGSHLAADTVVASPPYSSTLDDIVVMIGGHPAPLSMVSDGQINCLVPFGLDTSGGTTSITINNGGTKSETITVPLARTSPGLFANGIVHADGQAVNGANPAVPNEVLAIYLTGLGQLQAPLIDGAPAARAIPAVAVTTVQIDGVNAEMLYAGIASYPGLYQINVRMPETSHHGDVSVSVAAANSTFQNAALFAR
ncbi:MAG TPA: IPT/TIG domain-containing protein, partial [Bryobacteraceae bacterium]|nr:IPT/TIG domain-containing protein [Bryobacteraceae bacterium]